MSAVADRISESALTARREVMFPSRKQQRSTCQVFIELDGFKFGADIEYSPLKLPTWRDEGELEVFTVHDLWFPGNDKRSPGEVFNTTFLNEIEAAFRERVTGVAA